MRRPSRFVTTAFVPAVLAAAVAVMPAGFAATIAPRRAEVRA